jgi:hypothetical protein
VFEFPAGVDKEHVMGEKLQVLDDDDRYFDIVGLARYSGLSTGAIRRYMSDRERPLPHYHIVPAGKERGRVLYSKREFDAWVRLFGPTKRNTDSIDVTWIRRGFGEK